MPNEFSIGDQKELTTWLDGQPAELSVVIAVRAALRAVPALGPMSQSIDGRVVILRAFGALAPPSVAIKCSKEEATQLAGSASVSSGVNIVGGPSAAQDAISSIRVAGRARAARSAVSASSFAGMTLIAVSGIDASAQGQEFFFAATAVSSAVSAVPQSRSELDRDCAAIRAGQSVADLIESPLWADWPEEMAVAWGEMKSALESVDPSEHWHVWTRWYEDRLHGPAFNPDLEVARVLELTAGESEAGPAVANAKLAEIEARFALDIVVPEEGPGPRYALKNGRLSKTTSSPGGVEIAVQASLHRQVLSAASSLATRLAPVGNMYPGLAATARSYAAMVEIDTEALDVTSVWAIGGSLAAYATAYREQNRDRTLEDPLEPELEAELQSVVHLHGAFIMGFHEGRDLVDRADAFLNDKVAQEAVAEAGEPLLDAVSDDVALVDESTREIHRSVRDAVHEFGWGASRVGFSGYLIVRNAVRAMIKYTVGSDPNIFAIAGGIAGVSVLAGDSNLVFARAAAQFLGAHGPHLTTFFAHSPEMLAYVEWALGLLKRDQDRRDPEA